MDPYIIVPPIRKNKKKYSVLKFDKKNNRYNYLLSFGDKNYQHYQDKTPLRLYSHLDHNDEERLIRFWKRHKKSNDPDSANFWNQFLW
jgi:hypothetical protein